MVLPTPKTYRTRKRDNKSPRRPQPQKESARYGRFSCRPLPGAKGWQETVQRLLLPSKRRGTRRPQNRCFLFCFCIFTALQYAASCDVLQLNNKTNFAENCKIWSSKHYGVVFMGALTATFYGGGWFDRRKPPWQRQEGAHGSRAQASAAELQLGRKRSTRLLHPSPEIFTIGCAHQCRTYCVLGKAGQHNAICATRLEVSKAYTASAKVWLKS